MVNNNNNKKPSTTTQLMKSATFTDIHFGKKGNSAVHNQDCANFVDWFCEQVESDPEIDHIMFLGDWNENRSSLNIHTLDYSYKAAKKLNSLGLPIFFLVGNHDLYYRHSRDVHSITPFGEFSNFVIIDTPTVVEEIGDGGAFLAPYMFHHEYDILKDQLQYKTWWGHFEFKGFVITGHNITMPTGPDHHEFEGPDYVFSGHFHKRQVRDNIIYVGNAFPMDFGDADDHGRGMSTYNHKTKEVLFYDWEDCPKYIKTTLTTLLEKEKRKNILKPCSRVQCVVDVTISFEESTYLKQKFTEEYNLRELVLEESPAIKQSLMDTKTGIDWDNAELQSVDDLVLIMLNDIDNEQIDNQRLVRIYNELKTENER